MDCISYGRQVPVEVLELIFAMCLDGEYVRPAPLKAPLLLCQICSSWRRVALVMPPLWTSLSLHLDRRPGAWKTFLETWMGRSGNGPISLSLTGKRTSTYQYFNDHILKYFLKDSNRWRRLRLDVPATSLTKLLNTSMPLLETLEIAAHGTYPGVFISSADVPRLRILSLLDSQTNPTSIHVPWDRLTHFHAKYILDLDKAFPILAKCKNLKECTIYLTPVNGISASQHLLPLRMSRLRSLVVIGCIGEGCSQCVLRETRASEPREHGIGQYKIWILQSQPTLVIRFACEAVQFAEPDFNWR
ncbi:hypothetical protein B0H11DRAFT_1854229 [Mycena galericulata]|nr:hypothetical protein B0H11DRAFT_1854229 [Mycena galericulata]